MRKPIPAAVMVAALLAAPSAFAASSPTVAASAVTKIADTAATLHGTINANGLATTYQFEYGPTNALGKAVPVTAGTAGSGTAAVAKSARVGGLSPDTTYYYELVATNGDGTSTSPLETFRTTANPAPTSTTDSAAGIGRNFATLVGTIAPNNQATTYFFQYGLTGAYGLQTAVASIPAGTAPTTVTARLPGLAPGTVFHYRLVSSHGVTATTYGADLSFETLPWPRRHTSLSVSVRTWRAGAGAVRLSARGKIGLASATAASVGCQGIVKISYYEGSRRVASGGAFVGARCGFSAGARLRGISGRTRLTVRAQFAGNVFQAPASRSASAIAG